MLIVQVLLISGGSIFVILGFLHALYTFLDIRHPRRIVPDDPSVAAAMAASKVRIARGGTTVWKAWVGFNFSHSIGALLFGALAIATGALLPQFAVPAAVLLLFPAGAAVYLILSARYWFRTPTAGISISTACFLAAWALYVW